MYTNVLGHFTGTMGEISLNIPNRAHECTDIPPESTDIKRKSLTLPRNRQPSHVVLHPAKNFVGTTG
jgi:hypothetical protein